MKVIIAPMCFYLFPHNRCCYIFHMPSIHTITNAVDSAIISLYQMSKVKLRASNLPNSHRKTLSLASNQER